MIIKYYNKLTISGFVFQEQTKPQEKMDRETAQWDRQTDGDSVRQDGQTEDRQTEDRDSNESHTSSLWAEHISFQFVCMESAEWH